MTMPAKEAAKLLRRHNEWRRGADNNHWQQSPYSPAELGNAIDAAVAALEAIQDPGKVHINMLRGTIAKPAFRDMLHLYGDEASAPSIQRTTAPTLNSRQRSRQRRTESPSRVLLFRWWLLREIWQTASWLQRLNEPGVQGAAVVIDRRPLNHCQRNLAGRAITESWQRRRAVHHQRGWLRCRWPRG